MTPQSKQIIPGKNDVYTFMDCLNRFEMVNYHGDVLADGCTEIIGSCQWIRDKGLCPRGFP
jgi:hypothetical protein